MNAEIISVGTEIVTGHVNNTNAVHIGRKLSELGFEVNFITAVSDDNRKLRDVLNIASKRSKIIITSGGLGPTSNDITKETVCDFLGLDLNLHNESMESIKLFFEKIGREMNENNYKQALFPTGAIVLKNKFGTAPGCIIEEEGVTFILLPGPPRELIPMFDNDVLDYLKDRNGSRSLVRTVRLFGLGESAAEEKVRDLMTLQNDCVKVIPLAGEGEMTYRITVNSKSHAECIKYIEDMEDKLKSRLGNYVFGRDKDTLEKIVVNKLLEEKYKITVAESCTGGLIAAKLTDIPGVSEIFKEGYITYSNEAKIEQLCVDRKMLDYYGPVSPQVVEAMAYGALKVGGSDFAVASTGYAGPDDEETGLVYVAAVNKEKSRIKKVNIVGGRRWIKMIAAKHALNELRLLLEE